MICTLPSIKIDKSAKRNADVLRRYLGPSYSKKDTKSCLVLGNALKDIDPVQSRLYFEKGCALYDAESCMILVNLLSEEANYLRQRACFLERESRSVDFSRNQTYSSICMEYRNEKPKK